MNLPPFGAVSEEEGTHHAIVTHLSNLARECKASRDKWTNYADRNLTVYLHGEHPCPTADKRVINQIQNAILADVVIQTREKIKVTLEPAETGDPGEIYFADPAAYADPLTGQPIDIAPLDPAWVSAATQPQPTGMVDETGQPQLAPGAPAEAFVKVDDKFGADFWQRVHDAMWRRSKFDPAIKRWLTDAEVFGWFYGLYEWDDTEKRHRVRPLSVKQVYQDPTSQSLDEASYAGVDIVLDADEAAKLYPAIADRIREMAKDGNPIRPDENADLGRADMLYERKVVTLRVFWLRNQPFPMDPAYAVATGAVEQREVVDEQPVLGQDPFAGPADAEATPDAAGGIETGEDSDATSAAQVELRLPGVAPATRLAYFLPDTGEEVTPDAPEWPTRLGIRQLTVIENICVDDRENEHYDIPLLHNVNRPIPGKPWGIGEPMYLMNLQKARNSLLDGIVSYAEFFKNPASALPEEVAAALEKNYGDAYVKPGRTLRVPDHLWQQPGFDPTKFFWSPPQMAPAPLQAQDILKREINEQSGQQDAMRGILPSAQTSGKSIELLQDAGASMIQHKSQSTEAMIERLANLMHFSHVHRLAADLRNLRQIVSRHADHILSAAVEKAKASDFDITVIISSGSGANVAAKKQEAIAMFQTRDPQTGEPLQGIETTRDTCGIDHGTESERWATVAQQLAANAQAQAEQDAQREGEGENGPPGQAAA